MSSISSFQHGIEEINGVRCGLVEKNISAERVEFLKQLLEHNGFTVIVGVAPPPKVVAKPVAAPPVDGTAPAPVVAEAPAVPLPELFVVGVTDVTFSPVNAIYTRGLKTQDGKIVSPDYWNQKEERVKNGEWYWHRKPFD